MRQEVPEKLAGISS